MRKENLLSLFLMSLVILVNSQTDNQNYLHVTKYQEAIQNVPTPFPDYSQSISSSDFFINGAGGGGANISVQNGADLIFHISGSWAPSNGLRTGIITPINSSFNIPDTDFGEITTASDTPVGVGAKIESQNLVFYTIGGVSNFNYVSANLTANITNTAINFSGRTGSIHECPNGGGGGSSGNLSINNGIIKLTASGGWTPNLCNVKLGPILHITTSLIPNIELGVFKDLNGDDTNVKIKIENNWLVFYSLSGLIPRGLPR